MTAIAHGAHVVCEKPLALSAPQTRELLARARRADKKICPVHQFAKQRGVSKARRLLGGLGSLSSIRFEICSAGAADTDPTAHGNVLADILPHPLSVAACLWPEARLDEIEWQVITPTPGEVSAQCLVQNTPMTLSISMSGRPTRCAMEIQGSQGRLLVDFFHGFCVCFRGSVSRSRKVLYPFADSARTFAAAAGNLTVRVLRREPAYPGLEQLLRDFYAAVDEDADLSAADEVAVAIAVARDEFMRAMSLQATNPAAVPLDQARPG